MYFNKFHPVSTNVLFFKEKFKLPFSEKKTKTGIFKGLTKMNDIKFMNSKRYMKYFENEM